MAGSDDMTGRVSGNARPPAEGDKSGSGPDRGDVRSDTPRTMRTRVTFYAMHPGGPDEARRWAEQVYPAIRDVIAAAGGLPIPVSEFNEREPAPDITAPPS
jgi:hypothetical protein